MDLLGWIPGLLDARDEAGEPSYDDRQIRDFLAAMLLSIGFEAGALTPEVERLLAELSRRAGVDPGGSRADAERALARYFELNPLPPALVLGFRQGLREAYVRGSLTSEVAEAFEKYLSSGTRPGFEARAEPADGAVRGGPLGFFLARKKLDGDGA